MMMMQRIRSLRSLAVLLGLLTFAATPSAQARDFGLGIILGDPTGFTGKVWTGNQNAVDFGMAWSFGDYFTLYGDYLWHFPGGFGHSSRFVSELNPYVGVGLAAAFATNNYSNTVLVFDKRRFFGTSRDSFGLGVRIPLGIEWLPARPPIGVFVELAPGISVAPSTNAFFMGGVGARYYF